MSIIHEPPYQKAVPCRTIEHLITLQKVSFFLLARKTVNVITASIRKALFVFLKRMFPFLFWVLSMQSKAPALLNWVSYWRMSWGKEMPWVIRLSFTNQKVEGIMQPSDYWETFMSFTNSVFLECQLRHLKKGQTDMINRKWEDTYC